MVLRLLVDQNKIKSAVQRAERALAPDVIRIVYKLEEDFLGNPSLFFRVVISDAAAAPKGLYERTQRIKAKLLQATKAQDLGL